MAGPRVPGIDVSKYQGRIDWPAVASSPVRFVIMRATLGNRYRDERYARNLAGASENGLVVGAYHFAKPSLGLRDARGEADHFLRVARVASGDVLPVLDIEETGGLSPGQLRIWAQAWLARVESRTGVRAMIYSGNYFWRGFMRNSPWFGSRGHPLWVAHWNVAAPEVPGNRWAGNGYTIWQWSATGRIPGIRGPVDRDWVNGDLTRGTIASLTVVPPVGGVVRGERIACGGHRERCARMANPLDEITLTARPTNGARLIGWTGACEAAGQASTCSVTAQGAKTVSAVFGEDVDVVITPSERATGVSLPARVGCPIPCIAPSLEGPPVSEPPVSEPPVSEPPVSELPVSEPPVSEPPVSEPPVSEPPVSEPPVSEPPVSEPSPSGLPSSAPPVSDDPASRGEPATCSGTDPDCAVPALLGRAATESPKREGAELHDTRYSWSRERRRGAIGGSYRWERRGSASISYGFRGGAITLFTVKGPRMGKARIEIDGKRVATIDGYARRFRPNVRRRFSELGGGEHMLTITPLGRKRPAAKDRRVVVDALRWRGKLHRDPRPENVSWASVSDPSASEGGYVISDAPGAGATMRFSGTGLTLRAVRGPTSGRAQIWLDGKHVRTVDLYAATRRYASIPVASRLAPGQHVVRVVVLGTHRRASKGSAVRIDRWAVAEGSQRDKGHGRPPSKPRHEKHA
jgi:GH25 family lysozyme M1 (1,4-beta-N-acetylmuramidase)